MNPTPEPVEAAPVDEKPNLGEIYKRALKHQYGTTCQNHIFHLEGLEAVAAHIRAEQQPVFKDSKEWSTFWGDKLAAKDAELSALRSELTREKERNEIREEELKDQLAQKTQAVEDLVAERGKLADLLAARQRDETQK